MYDEFCAAQKHVNGFINLFNEDFLLSPKITNSGLASVSTIPLSSNLLIKPPSPTTKAEQHGFSSFKEFTFIINDQALNIAKLV